MWQVFILVICFGVYLLAGAVISYCFWYLLLLVFRPLKLERLFGIELPLPIVLSLLGIGIWYGYNINNFLSESSIQKHYECLFEPCNLLIANTIRNGLFLSSNKIVT